MTQSRWQWPPDLPAYLIHIYIVTECRTKYLVRCLKISMTRIPIIFTATTANWKPSNCIMTSFLNNLCKYLFVVNIQWIFEVDFLSGFELFSNKQIEWWWPAQVLANSNCFEQIQTHTRMAELVQIAEGSDVFSASSYPADRCWFAGFLKHLSSIVLNGWSISTLFIFKIALNKYIDILSTCTSWTICYLILLASKTMKSDSWKDLFASSNSRMLEYT